jgi:hypothetical protein
MARKLLVPVLPSDRFYDAVVAAGDVLAREGGIITFLFTSVRPTGETDWIEDLDGHPSDLEIEAENGDIDPTIVERWREHQVAALEDARQILYDRGIGDDKIDYVFAETADHESAAQAICDEAAAGAYDVVVLSRGYLEESVSEQGSSAEEILNVIQESLRGEVSLMVT